MNEGIVDSWSIGWNFRNFGNCSNFGKIWIDTVIVGCFCTTKNIVYFTFVIFRMPLNDNFIAVVLMILGYSLNDTIVIYDRVRENRRKSGPKTTTAELVNSSLNQCLTRTICTSITTIIAIGSVLVVSLIYGISSIIHPLS